ncbi:hypothetical protein BJV77DRAFT_1071235 [Russula vinacea]|nr:hypothetical protein BJV77DRAFT_1071235 [Russula vinacea]
MSKSMLALPGQLPTFLIIDALDECPNTTGTPSAREEVLDFLEDLVIDLSNLPPPVCLFTRKAAKGRILKAMSSLSSQGQSNAEMERRGQESRNSTLIERAGGMFRWAFCQLDTLRRCMPSKKRQHAHRLFQCWLSLFDRSALKTRRVFAIEFGADAGPNLKEGWRSENAEDAVLSTCSTLIAVIENEGSNVVQFSHFSVKST